jgi:hypothetical protein
VQIRVHSAEHLKKMTAKTSISLVNAVTKLGDEVVGADPLSRDSFQYFLNGR